MFEIIKHKIDENLIISMEGDIDNNKLTLKYDSRETWQDTTFGSFRHIFPAIKTEELC